MHILWLQCSTIKIKIRFLSKNCMHKYGCALRMTMIKYSKIINSVKIHAKTFSIYERFVYKIPYRRRVLFANKGQARAPIADIIYSLYTSNGNAQPFIFSILIENFQFLPVINSHSNLQCMQNKDTFARALVYKIPYRRARLA